MYTIREWNSGKLVSHQEDRDDADLDARMHACMTMRATYVLDASSHIVSLFDLNGNRRDVPASGILS